jgi:hypothetical protein
MHLAICFGKSNPAYLGTSQVLGAELLRRGDLEQGAEQGVEGNQAQARRGHSQVSNIEI